MSTIKVNAIQHSGGANVAMTLAANGSVTFSNNVTFVSNVDLSLSTSALKIPIGTTAQRPVGANGMIRFNSTTYDLEQWAPTISAWTPISHAFTDDDPFGDGTQIDAWMFNSDVTGVNGNNGSASNLTYGAGYLGNCAIFNGSNSYVNYPTSIVPRGDSPRTVSMWVYLNSAGSGARQLLYGSGIHGNSAQAFDIEANSYSDGSVSTNYGIHWWGNGKKFSGSSSVLYDQWVHLVVTHGGGNLYAQTKLYLNGSFIGDLSAANQGFGTGTSASAASTHQSGYRTNVSDLPVNGKIDSLRLFSRALNPKEITRLYNLGR